MSGWIKFWKDMPNDPRVLSAASKLAERYVLVRKTGGVDLSKTEMCNAWRNAVTGALATLWCYADEHIRDDDTLPLTSQTLDAVVGLEGFFDVMPREWIDELDDGSIILPGYCEKNSLIAKRKRTVKSNARVTRWRRAKKANGNGVTSKHVTQCNAAGDLDQDRDQDKREASIDASLAPTAPAGKQPTPEGEMAIALRDLGVVVRSIDPVLIAWVKDGFTREQAVDAVGIARIRKPHPEPIAANYLDKILRQPARPPPAQVKAVDRITWRPPPDDDGPNGCTPPNTTPSNKH